MKPFLLLATRADDAAADEEYEAFVTFGGLTESGLRRMRLEAGPLGVLDLEDYSGILVGGSPFTVSDPPATKSAVQRRVEAELDDLLDRVVAADFPFLGACYGIGALGRHEGGALGPEYAEPVGAVTVRLTPQGRADPVFGALPESFEAFVGHKEALTSLPDHAVLLASSASCPVQAFRVGRRVYATQFHPELDVPGICTRIDVYRHAGYFPPEEADVLKASVGTTSVIHPPALLRRFVRLYSC